jgi:hypothetical protein
MMTISGSAGGASAYSRTGYPAYSRLDDVVALRSNDGDSSFRQWSSTIDELLRIRTLKDDWDGEGTEAPHSALVDGAITLAQYLQSKGNIPPDRVHAGVNATVYFEWHTPLGYREIEIVSPVEAECRFVRKGYDQTEVVYLSRQS